MGAERCGEKSEHHRQPSERWFHRGNVASGEVVGEGKVQGRETRGADERIIYLTANGRECRREEEEGAWLRGAARVERRRRSVALQRSADRGPTFRRKWLRSGPHLGGRGYGVSRRARLRCESATGAARLQSEAERLVRRTRPSSEASTKVEPYRESAESLRGDRDAEGYFEGSGVERGEFCGELDHEGVGLLEPGEFSGAAE